MPTDPPAPDRDVTPARTAGDVTPARTAGDVTPARTAGDVAAAYCATLVDEWAGCGLTDAVVAPGSRSTPMALALARAEEIRVHVVHDERSAAFMALGLAMASGRPAVSLCTSGTAAANFHPAVVEAHHAAVPMLVVTADRPPELQGVGAPQTIDQRDLYRSAVRWFCEPGPPDDDGAPWWRDLARDAWVRTLGATPGPVHLNLAFREPLLGNATPAAHPPAHAPAPGDVPASASAPIWGLIDEDVGRLSGALAGRRGVIVAGARAARSDDDVTAVLALADTFGWPILADGPSGCRRTHRRVVTTFDPLLRHEPFAASHRPEFVLRLGGLPASRVTNEWLARSEATQIGVDRYGLVPDPDRVLARSLTADVATVCHQLAAVTSRPAPPAWSSSWTAAEAAARSAIGTVLSAQTGATEPAAAVDVVALIPPGGALVASSSMPVRDLEWFAPARDDVRMLANRGANGIDGVTSTAVGVALSGTPTVLLIGDVAFLHDTNALLGLAARGTTLVIVVVDNDGGGIFSFLPQATTLRRDRFEQLFGTPHGVDVVAVARAHGVPAERVSSRAGLQAAVAGAFTRGGPRVVAVSTDRRANVAVHDRLNAAVATAVAGSVEWDDRGSG